MNDIAAAYLKAGLCVLPASLEEKRPALPRWKQYQSRLPSERQVQTWFGTSKTICVLTGSVSANLEMIDFDCQGELFDAWCQLVESEDPALLEQLVIERSQSGGRHVVLRCSVTIPGSQKLATRIVKAPSAEPVTIGGKPYVPRKVDDGYAVDITLIETRGQGGLFLCAPTPGYVLEQGSYDAIPVLSEAEREILIRAARSLDETPPEPQQIRFVSEAVGRPGDDFNERGDVGQVLTKHGWTLVRGGNNQYWRRPGKQRGWSATLRQGLFYVFSTNAAPFEGETAYSPFSVYGLLEHGGDFTAAASALLAEGYGLQTVDDGVDVSALMPKASAPPVEPDTHACSDPGPCPSELLRIPGFVSEVMDHCLETAPYPNHALAFCGALALQSVLAARKVRDTADNRTNIYLLALAFSSVGKDWPRKLNTHILHRVGMVDAIGEKFASGEGIQDSLHLTPAMLFQTDEIDSLLQSITKSRDGRYESVMSTLLTLYSSSNSIYPMRRKASKEPAGVIDQPSLSILGTAIPTHYYAALSDRMLTNGFFARMLIVESGPRSIGQEPKVINPPLRVMETAQWWSDLRPGAGNLQAWHPEPLTLDVENEAIELLSQTRLASEAEYTSAEQCGDAVGTTVWGRVPEQTRKLALLYAISRDHRSPRIDGEAVRWATAFMLHQTRRMLFMVGSHVADNPFHAECLKLMRKLREAPDKQLPHSVLLKRMKVDAKTLQELIATLEQQGDVHTVIKATGGRPQRHYQALT